MLSRRLLRSILSGIAQHHPFALQNIPFSAGLLPGLKVPVCVSRIGDSVINLAELEVQGHFAHIFKEPTFSQSVLNQFMSYSPNVWKQTRETIQELLLKSSGALGKALVGIEDFTSTMPVRVTDFTDFYSCKNHRDNCGRIFSLAIAPSYEYLPIAYHSRASTVRLSGTNVRRPVGQVLPPNSTVPQFMASAWLDYEFEIGYFIGGKGNELGEALDVDTAEESIFGFVILNDWSARDIQLYEMAPLGPFTSKNLLTTISPWVVTQEALKPFYTALPEQGIVPAEYLRQQSREVPGIVLETHYKTEKMNDFLRVSISNFNYLYWSLGQQLAHHTVTGCALQSGSLIGSGTMSGVEEATMGSLLELTKGGREPLKFPTGEERGFLGDGDTVKFVAYAKNDSFTIGLGECTSQVTPAQSKFLR